MLDDGGELVWHPGDAAAFNAIVARRPRAGVSLAILCNAGQAADDADYEIAILDLLVPPAAPAAAGAAPAAPADVAAPDLSGRAGLFFNERTGDPLRLALDGGGLRIAGGAPLVALGDDRFRHPRGTLRFMSQDRFELRFVSQDVFELTSMEGETTRYRRAQPYAPSGAELADFAGRYETDEIGAVEISPAGSGLAGRLNGFPPIEVDPVAPDVFQRGPLTIRFRRDAAGAVIGLDLTTPVLRNAHFARGSAGTDDRASPRPAPPGDLRVYEGSYAMEAPDRVIDLRVWLDAQGRLNGELVGTGQRTTFRPGAEPHLFLHATRDDLRFRFTVQNGRATRATMYQGGREMSGTRRP
jgi:hypothetical protein